jgi:hypothetical protein
VKTSNLKKLLRIITLDFDVRDQPVIHLSDVRDQPAIHLSAVLRPCGVLHQLYIDFRKAYDSLRMEELYNILIGVGIPAKIKSY